ncbi:MAG TPA: outer membrane beta-barrel protein [Candidatus Acidoferrum sp.]|nr:outer membrane beta-barrel protein [Candidatus Acidoferrum sp.]
MNKLLVRCCVMIFALVVGGFVLVAGGSAQDWNGFYFGGNAGGVKGNSDVFTSTIFSPTGYFARSSIPAIAATGHPGLSPRGFTGGGQAGYNYQRRHWVLGVEADFGSMHVNDDFTTTGIYPCCAPTNFTITQTVSTDWLFTARPRIGLGNASVLVYGTGGIAMTNLNYKENFIDTFATAHESASTSGLLMGWTAGGGVEFKVGSGGHWSLKAEYLFADFGTGLKTTSTNLTAFTPPIAFPTNVFTHQADLTTHIFRAGFNYRF